MLFLSCHLIHIEILHLNKHPPQPMQSQQQWWRKIYNLPINLNWLTPRPNHSTEHSFSSSHHLIPLLTWMNFKSFARNFPFMKTWPFSQSIVFRSSKHVFSAEMLPSKSSDETHSPEASWSGLKGNHFPPLLFWSPIILMKTDGSGSPGVVDVASSSDALSSRFESPSI